MSSVQETAAAGAGDTFHSIDASDARGNIPLVYIYIYDYTYTLKYTLPTLLRTINIDLR